MELGKKPIAIIGLGYVGLPLAVEFGKKYSVIGYDINPARIDELTRGVDRTGEVDSEELKQAQHLRFTAEVELLRSCQTFIVTVPTPVDSHNNPDFTPLVKASETVGKVMSQGSVVIYESTVYPGATEEVCVPILERVSGLKYNVDFYCGYSPERINPGDKLHRFSTIVKVTSGSTPEAAKAIDALYASVVKAGTCFASSIRVAEAAKVIENTQRDINIAFVNELAILFHRLGLDTSEVLAVASTKWNFLSFKPGLVGGHCIGVDPYYLTYKAREVGYHPEIILAGRRLNDAMPKIVAAEFVKLMVKHSISLVGAKVLILGFTFKENCPDIRNSKVWDLYKELCDYSLQVTVVDPLADPKECLHEYGLSVQSQPPRDEKFDGLILAVPHRQFLEWDTSLIRSLVSRDGVVYDIKSAWPREVVTARL